MTFRTTILSSAATIALAMGSSAQASEYYVSVFGGFVGQNDKIDAALSGSTQIKSVTFKYTFPTGEYKKYSQTNSHYTTLQYSVAEGIDFDTGWVLGAAIGRDLGHSFRGELEVSYRSLKAAPPATIDMNVFYRFADYDHDEVAPYYSRTGNLVTPVDLELSGDLTSWSYMMNIWYDFEIEHSNFTPFIGGGIGASNVFLDYSAAVTTTIQTKLSNTFNITMTSRNDDSKWSFAYQFGTGLQYDFESGMVMSAQYRYFGTTENALGDMTQRIGGHNFLMGLNFPLN